MDAILTPIILLLGHNFPRFKKSPLRYIFYKLDFGTNCNVEIIIMRRYSLPKFEKIAKNDEFGGKMRLDNRLQNVEAWKGRENLTLQTCGAILVYYYYLYNYLHNFSIFNKEET